MQNSIGTKQKKVKKCENNKNKTYFAYEISRSFSCNLYVYPFGFH